MPSMMVATTTGVGAEPAGGAKMVACTGPSRIGSVEALSLPTASLIAQGGGSSELAAYMQNFKRRELEWWRLQRVATDVTVVEHTFVGCSFMVSFLILSSILNGLVSLFLIFLTLVFINTS